MKPLKKRNSCSFSFRKSISTSSEETEQIEEEVDEIKVKRERTVERKLLSVLVHFALRIEHLLDFLRVVSGKGRENHNSNSANDKVEHRIMKEDINDSCDNQTNKRHEGKLANSAQIFFREAAHERHSSESAGRHKESSSNRSHGEGAEDRTEYQSVEDTIDNKDERSLLKRHTHQAGSEEHYERKLSNEDSPE